MHNLQAGLGPFVVSHQASAAVCVVSWPAGSIYRSHQRVLQTTKATSSIYRSHQTTKASS
jgi:hypothetical protein